VECNQSENPVQRKRVENHERTYTASHADVLRLVTQSSPWGGMHEPVVTKALGKTKKGG